MSNRAIVIGDVHGCIDELDELLRTLQYKPGEDLVYFTGDLIDRGPSPVGVVRRAREIGAFSVMGNHEEKLVCWFKHEKVRKESGKKNPMQSGQTGSPNGCKCPRTTSYGSPRCGRTST